MSEESKVVIVGITAIAAIWIVSIFAMVYFDEPTRIVTCNEVHKKV